MQRVFFKMKEEVLGEFTLKRRGKEAKQDLADLLVDYFKPFQYEDVLIPGLTMYLHDHPDSEEIYQLTNNIEFRDEYLLNACREKSIKVDERFEWAIELGLPPNNEAKKFRKGIYLKIKTATKEPLLEEVRNTTNTVYKAKATITSLLGNIQRYLYSLDTTEAVKFNIGRGENPKLSNNMIHHNYIVIIDEEANRSVSRKHACILFLPSRGFCLQAYEGGCSSTKILRDNEKIELIVPRVEYALQDGDQIELGKAVILKFEIQEEKTSEKIQSPKAFKENDMGI